MRQVQKKIPEFRDTNMKRLQVIVVIGLAFLIAASAQAAVVYKSKVQMIETAEVVAVVEITNVAKVSAKGELWTYRQKASAKVQNVIKGKLPDNVSLYGDGLICGNCRFEVGRYLVFLDRDGGLLTGNNWELSARKITGKSKKNVEWLGDKGLFQKKQALLSDVLSEIAVVLARSKQAKA